MKLASNEFYFESRSAEVVLLVAVDIILKSNIDDCGIEVTVYSEVGPLHTDWAPYNDRALPQAEQDEILRLAWNLFNNSIANLHADYAWEETPRRA